MAEGRGRRGRGAGGDRLHRRRGGSVVGGGGKGARGRGFSSCRGANFLGGYRCLDGWR